MNVQGPAHSLVRLLNFPRRNSYIQQSQEEDMNKRSEVLNNSEVIHSMFIVGQNRIGGERKPQVENDYVIRRFTACIHSNRSIFRGYVQGNATWVSGLQKAHLCNSCTSKQSRCSSRENFCSRVRLPSWGRKQWAQPWRAMAATCLSLATVASQVA